MRVATSRGAAAAAAAVGRRSAASSAVQASVSSSTPSTSSRAAVAAAAASSARTAVAAAAAAASATPSSAVNSSGATAATAAATAAVLRRGLAAAAADGSSSSSVRAEVQEYYGEILKQSADLETNACETGAPPPAHVKKALARVHDDVHRKYYGCGLVMPTSLEGKRVLDLGCGSGRDVYVLAQLVGEKGGVVGVDMTTEQLATAREHEEWHAKEWGYAKKNTTFLQGYIEKLDELGLEDNSFDVVVSNCVINLSPDKDAVLRECFRVLKPGGELYFSDVYSDRRVPRELREDKVLWGECLSGALYWNDFHNLAKKHGFDDPRLVEDAPITVNNPAIEEKLGHIKFFSATYRLWKLPGKLEPACEDYGQAVIYKGTVPEMPNAFKLDDHHVMDTGRVFPVCGNTYNMLKETRLAEHFDFVGTWDTHYGIFKDCGTDIPYASASATGAADASAGGGGCC